MTQNSTHNLSVYSPNREGVVRFLTCGSVDDGKSTLIGHLLALTGNLYDDQIRILEDESRRIGVTGEGRLDYSLLMDGLMAEREQGITIDVAYRYFSAGGRKFIVADTPGHEQYTRNMATGASHCQAALILVDATSGVQPQTRRHAMLCSLMGIRRIFFAVNKMDMVGWRQSDFDQVAGQCRQIIDELEQFGTPLLEGCVVPVSALHGDNLTLLSPQMPWFSGPTVLEWLAGLPDAVLDDTAPLRVPVQYVIKGAQGSDQWQSGAAATFAGDSAGTWRGYAGTVASGTVSEGDTVLILPSGHQTTVQRILVDATSVSTAQQGSAVVVTLNGEYDVKRGDLLCHPQQRPQQADLFKVRLVWMDEKPLHAGRSYLCIGPWGRTVAEVLRISNRIDLSSYHLLATNHLAVNDIGGVELHLSRSIPFDAYQENRDTGSLILIDRLTNSTVACGMILHSLRRAENVHWHTQHISRETRAAIKAQRPRVIWFTGLSGSGKSTIANALEQKLSEMGRHTMLLDGDNVRHGLNKDLGFTEADRVENIRRVGEVARLMTDAGLIVITAFISPYRAEREMVRALLPEGEFIEIYTSTSLEECERRDVKGLYKKARAGQIPNFTGIDAPYEVPDAQALKIDTAVVSVEEAVDMILKKTTDNCAGGWRLDEKAENR